MSISPHHKVITKSAHQICVFRSYCIYPCILQSRIVNDGAMKRHCFGYKSLGIENPSARNFWVNWSLLLRDPLLYFLLAIWIPVSNQTEFGPIVFCADKLSRTTIISSDSNFKFVECCQVEVHERFCYLILHFSLQTSASGGERKDCLLRRLKAAFVLEKFVNFNWELVKQNK